MIFITDGELRDCPGETDFIEEDLVQDIIDSGVRIITIAFG